MAKNKVENLLLQVLACGLARVDSLEARSLHRLARQNLAVEISRAEVVEMAMQPPALDRLAMEVRELGLGPQAVLLSIRALGGDRAAARVFQDDLAEWLVMLPTEYRALREEGTRLVA